MKDDRITIPPAKKRLRIGFVSIEDASDILSWSGIPFQILSHLRQHSVDVEVISPLDRRLKCLLTPAILLAKARKQRLVLNHSSILLKSYARQIERQLDKRPVDVIVSANSIPITFLRCSQPVVFWNDAVFHNMVSYYPGFFSSLTASAIRCGKRQEERALQRSDAAIYSSNWAANCARSLTDPDKIYILPLGSSLTEEATEEEVAFRARMKRRKRVNSCELLFVGVEWERKGGDTAIEAARLLNDSGIKTRLRVVGSRPRTTPPDFVELLGFIPKSTPEGIAQLSDLFRSADLFILPTKAEAAGIVFSEASSFGLPTVTYDTGGVSDYVRDGVNGVCLPESGTAADFAATVRALLDPKIYEDLSVRAFQEYRKRLNWATSVEKLVGICELLVSERSLHARGRSHGLDAHSSQQP
jgi:glycosyltransferase involved in cell wall biosynthesis